MRFERAVDAINHVCIFHNLLSECYQKMSNMSNSEKGKLLLDYMAENEKTLVKRLSDYKEQAPEKILNTWFQYANDEDILTPPEFTNYGPIKAPEDVVEFAMKYSDKLIEFYSEMSNYCDNVALQEVFDNLSDMQNQEKNKLSMNIDRLMDF